MDRAAAQKYLDDSNAKRIVWDDNLRAQASNALRGSTPSSSSSVGDPAAAIAEATKRQQEAIQPAIQSFESTRPEITQKYEQARTQLKGQQQTLTDRYKNLLDSIKNNQTTAENRQTLVTNNELGKRGITGSSTLAQQEITNAVNPITQQYTSMAKDTGIAQEDAIQNIVNQLSGLTTNETADQRAITNAIASLQSNAGQQGISQGLNLYSNNLQQQLAQQEAAQREQQQAFENQLAQMQLANQTAQTQYDVNRPYFKPETGGGETGIASLLAMLGGVGNVAGAQSPTEPKPTYGMSTNKGPVYYR